jgi:hypothetical protein
MIEILKRLSISKPLPGKAESAKTYVRGLDQVKLTRKSVVVSFEFAMWIMRWLWPSDHVWDFAEFFK